MKKLESIMASLREQARVKCHKEPSPSVGIVDSLGFLLSVCVTAANIQDRQALPDLCTKMKGGFPRMRLIFANSGYEGRQNNVLLDFGWILSVVRRPNKKPDQQKVFHILPKRWIVERSLAWSGSFRRLSVDYEVSTSSAEAFIMIANIVILLKRIAS